jgi:hypothetical protein
MSSSFKTIILNMKRNVLRNLEPLAEGIQGCDTPWDDIGLQGIMRQLYLELDQLLKITGIIGKRTHTGYGYAIAPLNAGYCLLDMDRSFAFMKGLFEAIEEAKLRFPNQKIHILYAGTGPFASLVLPIAQHYEHDQVCITALDIHDSAILFLKKLVEELEFEAFFCNYLVKNACMYEYEGEPVTILLSETMAAGLLEEPQAAVFQNLESCLHPDGFLIPERIRLWASAAIMNNNRNLTPEKIELGEVLVTDRNWYQENPLPYAHPTRIRAEISIPSHESDRQTFLETDVQVTGDIRIPDRRNKVHSPLKVPLSLAPDWRCPRDQTLHVKFPLGGTRDRLKSYIA